MPPQVKNATKPGSKPPANPFANAPANAPRNRFEEEDDEFEEDFSNDFAGRTLVAEGENQPAVVTDFFYEVPDDDNKAPRYIAEFTMTTGEEKNKTIREWLSTSANARWKLVEFLEACGLEAGGQVLKFKKSQVLHRPMLLDISHGEYKGKPSHQVDLHTIATPEVIEAAERFLANRGDKPNV